MLNHEVLYVHIINYIYIQKLRNKILTQIVFYLSIYIYYQAIFFFTKNGKYIFLTL